MSLINDALKRAAESQKQNPSDSPPNVPLQPVNYAAHPNSFFRLLALLALLALAGVSIWALSKWWNSSRHANRTAASGRVLDAQGISVDKQTFETAVSANSPAQRPGIKVSTNVIVRADTSSAPVMAARLPITAATTNEGIQPVNPAPVETNTAAAVAPAPPAFPDLKLQSIIYRLNKPAVVINGEMLHAGEVIKDARVVRIERYEVTVVWRGETNVLSLPRL
jgi:hypothetical protein